MRYLFAEWPPIAKKLKKASRRLFLFDFDGTLAAIAPTPSQARMDKELRILLRAIARHPRTSVGVVSGRPLDQTKKLVALPELVYAGNHGLEVEDVRSRFVHPSAKENAGRVTRMAEVLKDCFKEIPGVLVENKHFTLGVHYRLVKDGALHGFRKFMHEVVRLICIRENFVTRQGKRVIEILPKTNWNKGSAINFIKEHINHKSIVLFAGDDVTDEDAFDSLRSTDISIHIGRKARSKANYYLKSQHEVKKLLEKINQL